MDSILSVLYRVDELDDTSVTGLAVASVIIGKSCWEGTIEMFASMSLERRERVLE